MDYWSAMTMNPVSWEMSQEKKKQDLESTREEMLDGERKPKREKVSSMSAVMQVHRPIIPYRGPIPGGLHEGKVIEIRGKVPYGADVFTVNLVSGMDVVSDRPFHLSVRFNDSVVVRNHFQNRCWGTEDRYGSFPFRYGEDFNIAIVAEATHYRISVNYQNCWDFNHRIPLRRVTSILIEGCVQIERIKYVKNPGSCISNPFPRISQPPSWGGSNLVPVYNPSVPYAYPIYGGLKQGMVMHISRRPFPNATRFTINLQSGTSPHIPPDIAFHFGVRFPSALVVRNTRVGDCWEREERDLSHFPFTPGYSFDLCIRVQKNRFAVELGGQHLLVFTHRLKPLSRFDTLFVEWDVEITCIRFE